MIQSNKCYKSPAVGVTSNVGLLLTEILQNSSCLRNTTSLIPLRYRRSRGTSHYKTLYFCVYEKNKIFWFSVAVWLKCWKSDVDLTSREFANGPEDRASILGRVIPKTQKKWHLLPLCLTLWLIWVTGKVGQSRERSDTFLNTLV